MEDLWRVQSSGIDLDELADIAEYRRFLKRFCLNEERDNRQRLLYEEEPVRKPEEPQKT